LAGGGTGLDGGVAFGKWTCVRGSSRFAVERKG